MAQQQPSSTRAEQRRLLARPLDALAFLLPLIVFYELASVAHPDRVIAFDLLRRFFELFGHVGMWAPGVGIVVILLATQVASGENWRIRWTRVGLMYVEAVVAAVPLLALNWAIPLQASGGNAPGLVGELAFGIGAGIYEELVFRLILISLIVMVGVDLFRFKRASVALAAIAISALLFAAHHYQPIGVDLFDWTSFAFRAIAGAYLALIFWFRGYGSAAGCHAAYNVGLLAVGAVAG